MSNSFGNQWKIPEAWEVTSIKSITSDWRGGAPFKPDDFTDEGFPVLHKGAIHKSGTVVIDSRKKTFTSAEYAQCYQKSVIDNTYMAVTLRDLVPSGPSIGLVANLANSQSEKYVLAQGAYGFHINTDKVHPSYLVWLSNYEPFRAYMKCFAVGSTQIHIRTPVFQELQIPLPPLEEQKRIAAILDKADRVRRKRQEAIRLTEELGRSIFLNMFGDPVTNPKRWEIVEIDQVVDAIESGWSPKCDSRIAEPNEWGVLKLGAITWGTFNEQENKALLPDTTPKSELEVQPGDLLFTRKNTYELVGASAYVHQTRSKLLLPDLIFRLKVNNKVNPIYLWQALSQSSMRQEISLLASGSSGSMPNISKARLRTLKIALPSLELQNKFSMISEKYWKKQALLQEYKKQTENLFNSLLQRAFRGEL